MADKIDVNRYTGGTSDTVGLKFDQDKPRMELIDPYAMEQLAWVLTFGAKKYHAENWRKGISIKRLIGSSLRHLIEFAFGQEFDKETGLSHASHLMCNAMFIVWMMKYNRQWDDRWVNKDI